MNNLELLTDAIAYMEAHIEEDLKTEDIASACYCAKSTLDKLFSHVAHISVREYLIKRRMTLAARKLVSEPDVSILDVALMSGYSSPESFTRAFQLIYSCNPSEFRKQTKLSDLFPRIKAPLENGDKYMSERKNFDISELYDLFRERRNCYFVCCDIKKLVPINEISHKAGDLAILESMRRMDQAAGDNDIVFRIGGDEFAMLTNSDDETYAGSIINEIKSYNENPINFEGRQIPLSLHTALFKLESRNIKYDELFTGLHKALRAGIKEEK